MSKNWDEYFIEMCWHVASKSKDDSTQVGCVLVTPDHDLVSTGFNGFPRGVKETETTFVSQPFESGVVYPPGTLDQWRDGRRLVQIPVEKLLADRWHKRPEKYEWVEHAERNAVFNAARLGVSTKGTIAYLPYEPTPCADCTRALIQAGVIEIVGTDIPFRGVGTDVFYHIASASKTMLDEAGVKMRIVPWASRLSLESQEKLGVEKTHSRVTTSLKYSVQ